MKKILIIITILLSSLLTGPVFSDLESDLEKKDVSSLLNNYAPAKVVKPGDATVETGLKTIVETVVTNLSYILGILAIGAIVYGGIIMVISVGEDEKVSKGKNIIKWALIGFAGLVSAAGLIRIVISVMFGLSNV